MSSKRKTHDGTGITGVDTASMKVVWSTKEVNALGARLELLLKLKLSVLTLSQRLVTPRTPRISGARLGVQPLQLPEIPIHYKWGPQ